jgi:hypothetical protein
MKNSSEGETLGIHLEDEGEGEIHRGMNLSEGGGGGEGKSPRNFMNRQRGALVTRNHPWVVSVDLEKKKRGETEGVREPPLIPRSPTRRIYPARIGYIRHNLT